eukprot:COSAG05_NODE_2493_length_2990_cov_1.086129_1_plen_63_part_00
MSGASTKPARSMNIYIIYEHATSKLLAAMPMASMMMRAAGLLRLVPVNGESGAVDERVCAYV